MDTILARECSKASWGNLMRLDTIIRNARVTRFNIYLMSGDEERTLGVYKHKTLPHYHR